MALFLLVLLLVTVEWAILDLIITPLYCRWRKKHDAKNRCFFWNCSDTACPYHRKNFNKKDHG